MGLYEIGCTETVSGADNMVKSAKLTQQAQQYRAQANKEIAKGNWTHAADLNDKATALEKQAASLSALPQTKSRIAARHKGITGAGVAAAVGIAATLGIVGYAASHKKG